MSSNRQRNIFTLVSQEKSARRQPVDPFERDPFKIHSYNFRYADRPSFQMPVLQPTANNRDYLKDCQTYFYNYNFPSANMLGKARNTTSLQTDGGKLNCTKFQEYRRRTYLNETESYRNGRLMGTKENQISYTKANDNNIAQPFVKKDNCIPTVSQMTNSNNNSLASNYSQASLRNNMKLGSAKRSLTPLPRISISADRIPSLDTGCEISIDIKGLNKNCLRENVNIKIGTTDSVSRNLDIPLTKTLKSSNEVKQRTEHLNSSNSFVGDKNLSHPDRQNNAITMEKGLSSIYGSQRLKKSSKACHIKSSERLPSLIPFRSTDSRHNLNSKFPKESLSSKKTLSHTVRDNLSVYNSKAVQNSREFNNFNGSPYNLANEENKLSSSSSLTAKQSYSKRCHKTNKASGLSSNLSMSSLSPRIGGQPAAPLRTHSSVRLPLNVTINVIADKLKLLKI